MSRKESNPRGGPRTPLARRPRPVCALVLVWLLAGLVHWPEKAFAAFVFSALEEGHWVAYWQRDLGIPPERLLKDSSTDQGSARFGADANTVAFENSRSEISILQRDETRTAWKVVQTIPNAVRPAWNGGLRNWAFIRYTLSGGGEDSDIYGSRAGGRGFDALVRHTGNQDYPHLSPDGARLVYTSTQIVGVRQGMITPFQQLWIVNFAQGPTYPLPLPARENIEAAWSPSGEEIAFAANAGGEFNIWIVRADGAGLRQVTSGSGAKTAPAWSPDGRRLIFTHFQDRRYGLAFIDLDGRNVRPYHPFGEAHAVEVRAADWK